MAAAEQLERGLQDLGIELTARAQKKLLAYATLLEKWNRTYRLTAVPNAAQTVSHHLLDSLAVLPFLSAESLLDVGSGGGMPGIPLAIARPELRVVLLDSNSKKSAFLRQAAIELELANIAVHCGRVEEYRPAFSFAAITARAFADLAELVRLSRHLLQVDGHWLAMKGICPQAEIARLPADVAVEALHRLAVPGVTGERHLVLISSRAVGH
ncbi:MAG: Ribosomal RNA small subunit methyltransferase G [Candidatus Accumulibacter regalis]|jgi:16S rRNA (guanine527-N7)-methyltransferase|uniref:Ribosomal RNA small subunit methyltransferase G n=1 Tax=Accumulibacter regalis TaxID=522306 RepID=A0A011PUX7_ACCRE|nr:16S rRNA (guanine(527)-N(7))-methyltransferase RsmG [Accumulibacter sp.]EXI91206.1 MAG: Ribosomal RNA small subunit methyltransferase G [Candidatus Accumulibacter regalis]MBL8368793.1 16S rRNA (guanine(527)-N(7))-methyltransferase RsmG [Accumulibacter sp.]MBN8515077.1 16S rRNA (guanine(527)-N(7))-methyltransferase RsmG [Accumulibacter sp.]MBO3703628.1 16S rRNA (guanine(527)-N(7))-methyltransferase RsmG [Accumulibacter sp.]HRE70130.1 16S rRNA (guanine(527)-N(7))-methyltransferase RsmG [Accum